MTLALLLVAALATAEPPEITLTPATATLRLAVAGDTGEGSETLAKAMTRVHAKMPFDAILLTGDNFYPCGVTSVDDPRWSLVAPLTRVGVPIFPVFGNHDFCGEAVPEAQNTATGVIPHWRFPAPQYALRTPMADFAFVNTTPLAHGGENAVESMIRGTFADSRKPWRIVVGHHPVISSGWHGYFPRDEVARMRGLIPALRETNADFYICGHDHHVELLRGRMLHLVSGAGSEPIPPLKLRLTTVFPSEIRRERIGFAVVEITNRAIRVRMYDANGRPRSGWISGRVRHEPRGHGPVLLQHFDETDEHIIRPHADLSQPLHDVGVDRALGGVGASFVERDLDDQQIAGTLHGLAAREGRVSDDVRRVELVKDLEPIAGGDLRFLDERFMDRGADLFEKFVRLAFAERDGDERHDADCTQPARSHGAIGPATTMKFGCGKGSFTRTSCR
jgi:hypothetical protein